MPVGGYDQGNSQIRISVGGNPNLQPEKAENQYPGPGLQPQLRSEGFDVSLDWWQIELTDAITTFSGQAILDECIRNNQPQFCSLYTRNPGGTVNTLLSSGVNASRIDVEGYDMTMNYRLPDTAWGNFSFVWDSTYLARYEIDQDDNNLVGEYGDTSNYWRVRSNLMTRWEMGDWGATWASRYYSRQDEDCQFMVDYGFDGFCSDENRFIDDVDGNPVQAAQNKLGGTTYHDVSVYWNAPWNARVTLGVNNIGDKDPPISVLDLRQQLRPAVRSPGPVPVHAVQPALLIPLA